MKKWFFLVVMVVCMSSLVLATDVKVQMNGEIVNFRDEAGNTVNAQIVNARTLVPMRKIFEILGATVEWDGENKIVTGTKDNIVIELQIGRDVAYKTVNGNKEEIKLDTAPMIINNRTMVPLRFIAESLEKQVGWDNNSRTAIIIDYSYFTNVLKTNAPALYHFLMRTPQVSQIRYTNSYRDLEDATQNQTLQVDISSSLEDGKQNVLVNIGGNHELAKEIVSEKWNQMTYSLTFGADSMMMNSSMPIVKEMLAITGDGKEVSYKELSLEGGNVSFENLFRVWANVSDNSLNDNTFSILKNDFQKLCNLFQTTNTSETKLVSQSSAIQYATYQVEYFDLMKLDNLLFDNPYIQAFNTTQKMFFKNEIEKEEVLYDFNKISISFTVDDAVMTIKIEAQNDYQEKYVLEFQMS